MHREVADFCTIGPLVNSHIAMDRSIFNGKIHYKWPCHMVSSMGDLQDPIDGGTLVPYFWPYELWGYSLKFRPEK